MLIRKSLSSLVLLFAGTALRAQMTHEGHGSADPSVPALGTIDFPTSASEKSHAAFVQGVLYMHNFHYPRAAQAFRQAQQLDSTDVMGYWGEAMSYTHPVWNEQDTAAAHAALMRLGPSPEARLALARNDRERGWLNAVEMLYAHGTTKAHRDTAYSAAMASLHESDTSDVEATTFYALSLLGLNQGDREPVAYQKAYELVAPVFNTHPHHPGAAHYLIHAVDDPEHAALGAKAASAYSEIAPSAAHAIHMTSHIFLALGKWDDVVNANVRALNAMPKGVVSGHGAHWLHYGLVQQGRYHEADRWLDSLVKRAGTNTGGVQLDAWDAAGLMAAANVADTRRWSGLASSVRVDSSIMKGHPVLALDLASAEFGYALAALNRGDRAKFDNVLAGMTKTRENLAGDPTTATSRGMSEVMEKTLRGYALWKSGSRNDALALFREAATQEASLPMPFGPPVTIKPPREAAGEILLEMKRPADAKAEFTLALARTPGRVAPLLGLARSEKALGNIAESRKRYAQVLGIWHLADRDVSELGEVQRGGR
jgi:tetratricopeptide (TPR) repeat protein